MQKYSIKSKEIASFGGALILMAISSSALPANSAGLSKEQMNDKDKAQASNVAEAKKLNGEKPKKTDQLTKDMVQGVNQVPGVNVQATDLQAPPEQPPIKGFHPLKRLMRPVENLEGMSIKLEQQIMKLEGPIAGLQPPMIGLQKRMKGVDEHINEMRDNLNGVQGSMDGTRSEIKGVRADLISVRADLTGVRHDIAEMRKDISGLRGPIVALQKPIVALQTPLGNVAHPLLTLQSQLNWIILAIMVSAISIALGTPIAAIQIYKHRKQLFPDLKEHDLAKPDPVPAPVSSRR